MLLPVSTLAISLIMAQHTDGDLALRCPGIMSSVHQATTHNADGSLGPSSSERVRTEAEALVRFTSSESKIRLPALEPIIRSETQDGWRPLNEVEMADDLITARFSLNFLDRPRVRIDRMTGTIEVIGIAGRFVGQCEPYDATARRF